MSKPILPKWLTKNEKGVYVVDADQAFPIALKALGLDEKLDQYALECAYQCVKMKTQEEAAANGDYDPEGGGKTLVISIECKDKEKWRHANHPEGRGVLAATKGREAKAMYPKVRNKLG